MSTQDVGHYNRSKKGEETWLNNHTTANQDPTQEIKMSEVTTEGAKLHSSLPPAGVALGASSIQSITTGSAHDHLEFDVSQRRFGLTQQSLAATRRRAQQKDMRSGGKLHNLQSLFSEGIANPEFFFAETGEDSTSFLYKEGQITNQAVLDDNEQYFLRNIGAAKLNMLKMLIMKIESDRNLTVTMKDFFSESSKWASEDPQKVIKEVYSRLNKVGQRNNPGYKVMLKLIDEMTMLETQHKYWQKKRLGKIDENITEIFKNRQREVLGISGLEEEQEDGINLPHVINLVGVALENAHSYTVSGGGVPTLDDLIGAKIDEQIKKGHTPDDRLFQLRNILNDHDDKIDILYRPWEEVKENYEQYKKVKKDFVESHNKLMGGANVGVEEFFKKTDESVMGILAFLSDRELRDELEHEEKKNIEDAINAAIASTLTSGENDFLPADPTERTLVIKNVRNNLDAIIAKHQNVLRPIYDAKYDKINTQNAFNPFQFGPLDKRNEDAILALRDSIYLASLKSINPELYEGIYDDEAEESLLSTATDQEVAKLKPKSDKVNDLFNAYLFLQRAASSEIDTKGAEALMDSELFTHNSALSEQDKLEMLQLSKDFSKKSISANEKNIFPTYTNEQIKNDALERIYINEARHISQKRDRSLNNLLAFFAQNNEAIFRFTVCMENAINPTTTVETTPSLSRACFDKLENELKQDSKESSQMLERLNAMTGLNPFAVFFVLKSLVNDVQYDLMQRAKYRISRYAAEETTYIATSEDRLQGVSRTLNLEADDIGEAGTFVKSGHENQVIRDAEVEATAYDIAEATNVLPAELRLTNLGEFSGNQTVRMREMLFLESVKQSFNNLDKKINHEKANFFKLKKQLENTKRSIEEVLAKTNDPQAFMSLAPEQKAEEILKLNKELEKLEDNEKSLEALIKISEAEIELLGKRNKEDFYKRLKDRSAINLKNMSTVEKLDMMELLSDYREALYDYQFKQEVEGKKTKQIESEIARLNRVIPILQRDVLSSNAVLTNVIRGELRDNYGVTIPVDLQNKIKKHGLSEQMIVEVMTVLSDAKHFPNISKQKLNGIRIELQGLYSTTTLLKTIKTDKLGNPYRERWGRGTEAANLMSNYLRKVGHYNDKLMQKIETSNSLYLSKGETYNNMVYISGGKNLQGYLHKKINHYQKVDNHAEAEKLYQQMNSKGMCNNLSVDMQKYIATHHDSVTNANNDATKARMTRHKTGETRGGKSVMKPKSRKRRL
ncbi:MAG TPA: hypothetical protein ENN12_03530 [Epsilonproteobacteria bacterium]|nr:hypothetical protein [Campylobacterota bacterium]